MLPVLLQPLQPAKPVFHLSSHMKCDLLVLFVLLAPSARRCIWCALFLWYLTAVSARFYSVQIEEPPPSANKRANRNAKK